MSSTALRRWGSAVVMLSGLLLGSRTAAAQQATVTGRVTAQESTEPLGDVRVIVVGTTVFAITNAEGRYTLRNVPPGTPEIRVLRVGYMEQKKRETVTAGQTTTVDFVLARAVIQLQEVVTTATGESRKVELGNTVATIDVAKKLDDAPIKNMGDLLVAKAPGVQVLPANMTGGGSRVRIRGTNSISLSNDPIYIIDGVRMTSGGTAAGAGIGVGRHDAEPRERHQPRGHREHRGREGAVGRDAVRHRRRKRRHRDHDAQGTRGASGVVGGTATTG